MLDTIKFKDKEGDTLEVCDTYRDSLSFYAREHDEEGDLKEHTLVHLSRDDAKVLHAFLSDYLLGEFLQGGGENV